MIGRWLDPLLVRPRLRRLFEYRHEVTRREVMEVFDTIPGDHPKTLEARIKGFGKLVRSGTLILIDDGVFAMAQNEMMTRATPRTTSMLMRKNMVEVK